MKIAILRVGKVDEEVITAVKRRLWDIFHNALCTIFKNEMLIPQDTYNAVRRQYYLSEILTKICKYAKNVLADRVLGMTEVDLYVPRLNFVFGEAQYLGRVAIISIFRLKPEFCGQVSNKEKLLNRSVKEAVHELGHTVGLEHCVDPLCVMSFSNNIIAVDTKKSVFCKKYRDKMAGNGVITPIQRLVNATI